MPNRADDWFSQAVRNLEQAEASRQESWGHVVARLLEDLPNPAPADLIERSKVLDNFYPE